MLTHTLPFRKVCLWGNKKVFYHTHNIEFPFRIIECWDQDNSVARFTEYPMLFYERIFIIKNANARGSTGANFKKPQDGGRGRANLQIHVRHDEKWKPCFEQREGEAVLKIRRISWRCKLVCTFGSSPPPSGPLTPTNSSYGWWTPEMMSASDVMAAFPITVNISGQWPLYERAERQAKRADVMRTAPPFATTPPFYSALQTHAASAGH